MTSPAQGVLSGNEIVSQLRQKTIRIEPFNEAQVNPASYDLTLGTGVAVYKAMIVGDFRRRPNNFTGYPGIPGEHLRRRYEPDRIVEIDPETDCLDVSCEHEVLRYEMGEDGLLLKPGIGYLMHTAEHVWTDTYVPVLDGKSSIGRLFVAVHVTAGYGDAGFDGQYTLEVVVTHPVILYPGMRIGQIRFHTMVGDVTPYDQHDSNYTGILARGPVPSRAFRQIARDKLPIRRYDRSRS